MRPGNRSRQAGRQAGLISCSRHVLPPSKLTFRSLLSTFNVRTADSSDRGRFSWSQATRQDREYETQEGLPYRNTFARPPLLVSPPSPRPSLFSRKAKKKLGLTPVGNKLGSTPGGTKIKNHPPPPPPETQFPPEVIFLRCIPPQR